MLMPAGNPATPTIIVLASALRCRALGRYPFIWVSLSPGISFPTPIGAGLAMGAGVHGWKERGGDNAEGQLETLPKTPRRQKTAEETEGGRTRRGDICCFRPKTGLIKARIRTSNKPPHDKLLVYHFSHH